jgi:hypothetical protein
MIKHLLSSATFSPPDDLGFGSGETVSADHDQGGSTEPAGAPSDSASPEPSATEAAQAKPRVETITQSVRRAISETKSKADAAERAPRPPKRSQSSEAAGGPADKPAKTYSEPSADGGPATAPEATSGPPQTWSKEERAIWNDLPEAARATINRREAASARGVHELRSRYQEIDTAVAPYSAVMKQNNVTAGQAINKLFAWHMELAGPNKVAAFRQLAQNFGVDPAALAGGGQYQQPQQQAYQPVNPVISNLEARMNGYEQQNAAAARTAAEQTWANWSQGKPHTEKVRGLMAQLIIGDLNLIQAGQPQISNTIKNGSIDIDAAYQAALYAHPEVRETLLREGYTRRDKEAKAAAERARKTGVSMRSGAPAGTINGRDVAPKVETARESIMRALNEVRGH